MAKENRFGESVVQLRKEKSMTQKDLAERLNVSDKAVSRWETGKNYPDIETLQRLAQIFEVPIDDLLQGNLKLSEEKSPWKMAMIIAAIIIVLLYIFPVHHWYSVTNTNVFGTRESSYLLTRGWIGDRMQVADIMDTAEAAFSDVGISEKEAKEKYGALSRYCFTSDTYENVVKEKHKLKLWTVMLRDYTAEDEGYMWVWYTQEGLDKNNKLDNGSYDIEALWYLARNNDGGWHVIDIKEAP